MTIQYEHIFFDLDRTLWDFETNSKLALKEIFHKHDIEARSNKSFDKFYKTYKSVNAFYWKQYRYGNLDKETLRSIRFTRTLESLSIKDPILGAALGEDYIAISPYQTALFPNTMETLNYLKDKGYNMHIITNGFKEVQPIKMNKSGIESFFDQVIISEEFGKNKPHPSIFHHAIELADASIEKSIMIGDSIEADLLGARGVDMDQIYFNPEGIQHKHTFTHEITDLKALQQIF